MTVPWLLDHAPYAPFVHDRTARPPGLSPLDMGQWTVRDPDYAAQMMRRREVLAEHPDIALGVLHEGEAPALELLSMLKAHLGHDPKLTLAEEFCALTAIGHLVAEDFCLMVPDPASGEYKLAAAVLCFPSRWLLSEKLGRPMTIIHAPVPDYDDTLARRVNRVFEAIDVRRPMVRINWLIHPVAELFLPIGLSDKLVAHADPGDGIYLRTERQTLVRLPETGAIAFGIKTSICPLDRLTPTEAAALAARLVDEDAETLAQRSGSRLLQTARARLSEIACADP